MKNEPTSLSNAKLGSSDSPTRGGENVITIIKNYISWIPNRIMNPKWNNGTRKRNKKENQKALLAAVQIVLRKKKLKGRKLKIVN